MTAHVTNLSLSEEISGVDNGELFLLCLLLAVGNENKDVFT